MGLPNAKELKKFAKSCREAGISHFKSNDFEFTLSENFEKPTRRTSKKGNINLSQLSENSSLSTIESDALTDEQLLMWSVSGEAATESVEQ